MFIGGLKNSFLQITIVLLEFLPKTFLFFIYISIFECDITRIQTLTIVLYARLCQHSHAGHYIYFFVVIWYEMITTWAHVMISIRAEGGLTSTLILRCTICYTETRGCSCLSLGFKSIITLVFIIICLVRLINSVGAPMLLTILLIHRNNFIYQLS